MKTVFKYMLFFIVAPLFLACNSENEITEDITKELKVSVPQKNEKFLTTEDVDFEFEIIEGNGGYSATVSEINGEPLAKVTIDGNKVIVNLLSHLGADITISDQKDQEATVYITSLHESLQTIHTYGLHLNEGDTYSMPINFGAGAPYTIEKLRGNASTATIVDSKVKATSLGLGDTYYKLRDKRGSTTRFQVSTQLQFKMDMSSNYLEFKGVNNLTTTIELQWGTDWEIVGSSNTILESVSVARPMLPSGGLSDKYTLFIYTVDEGTGSDIITLKNKDGDFAVVKVHVK